MKKPLMEFALTAAAVATGVAVVFYFSNAPLEQHPLPMVGGLTTEQHQMLMETHCYAQGGEWGPIHGCTMIEVRP